MNKPANKNSLLINLTKKDFLKEYNVPSCQKKYEGVKTCRGAINTDAPKISTIISRYGRSSTSTYLETWLYNLADSINVKSDRNLTMEQIREASTYIVEEYYDLNLAEITLVFKKIKKGEFGYHYEGLDMMKIMNFFRKYREEKRIFYYEQRKKQVANSPSVHERAKFLLKNIHKMPKLKELYEEKGQSTRSSGK